MRLQVWCIFLVICGANARPPGKEEQDLLPFGLDEVLNKSFSGKGFNGTWISDTVLVFKTKEGDLKTYDIVKDEYSTLVSVEDIRSGLISEFKNRARSEDDESSITDEETKPKCLCKFIKYAKEFHVTGFSISPNQEYILFNRDTKQGFRHSSIFRCFIYNIKTKQTVNVANNLHVQLAKWVPESSSVVFVRDNNVYLHKAPNRADRELQLTNDGDSGVKYNGVADWVYEEEMLGTSTALWFSPNGEWIAVASFDDTNVDEVMYFKYGESGTVDSQYPELMDLRYPKSGRTNPTAKVRLLRLAEAKPRSIPWIPIPAPISDVGNDHLLADVTWASNSEVAVTWLNRRQNLAVMQICEAAAGSNCKTELKLEEPNGWVSFESPWFNPSADSYFTILPVKQTDGTTWPHLVGADRGSQPKAITSGNRTVLKILGVDWTRDHIFYTSTSSKSSAHEEVFVAGSKSLSLTQELKNDDGTKCRFGAAKFSKNYSYAVVACTGPDPAKFIIYDVVNERVLKVWEDNHELRDKLSKYSMPIIRDLKVDLPKNFQAEVRMYLPPGFDESDQTQKYPLIVSVYAGPGSKKISDTYGISYLQYIATNRKFIYCEIDGRGTARRSNELMFQVNNALGTVEIEDQISVTQKLKEKFKFIDSDRVAIWGWSYGGYATTMALIRDKENVFKCGVSVAPVTSWLYYDTIYTERYMGVPKDNPIGYNESDVTLKAESLRGKKYLLIHGNADDNVHYQNAMQLVRQLELKNIPFESQSYPNEAHSLSGVLPHVYNTIDNFWTRCFNLTKTD